MSKAAINNFLKALEAVKEDYTCKICSNLCKNPVILSKCFHMICGEHFEGLKNCPACGVSLEDCTTFHDERLGPCIESTKTLDQLFEKHKTSVRVTPKKSGKKGSVNSERKADSSLDFPIRDDSAPKKNAQRKIENTSDNPDISAKENKVTNQTKFNKRDENEPNISVALNASSKINKIAEKRNKLGETALQVACRHGKVGKVKKLLNKGSSPNSKDIAGWTPLHEVVLIGRLDLVKLLLQHNALINVPGPGNKTPLHDAVRFGFEEIAEELVNNGADINAENNRGETPLQLASPDMKEIIQNATKNPKI